MTPIICNTLTSEPKPCIWHGNSLDQELAQCVKLFDVAHGDVQEVSGLVSVIHPSKTILGGSCEE